MHLSDVSLGREWIAASPDERARISGVLLAEEQRINSLATTPAPSPAQLQSCIDTRARSGDKRWTLSQLEFIANQCYIGQ
jgi:hypothetical protein